MPDLRLADIVRGAARLDADAAGPVHETRRHLTVRAGCRDGGSGGR